MRRLLMLVLGVFTALVFATGPALAASPHFKSGGVPTCTFAGTTSIPVICTGTVTGLGNQDLNIHLSASGFALYQCQNNGGNIAPGQNKVLEGPASSDTAIPANAIKNGNLTFTTNPAVLSAAATVSGAAAGCQSNWTGVNPVLTLTSITLDIFQPLTTRIFHCTATNPRGLSSPTTLSC